MINSTPSPDRTPPPQLQLPAQPKRSAPTGAGKDTFTPQQLLALRAAIDSQPLVREDMIVRGMALAADDGYPPKETIAEIAQQILKANDLAKE